LENQIFNSFVENYFNKDIHPKCSYELAFIGAGISTTYALIHFIELLEKQRPKSVINILILDKSGEFWTGIPYGSRSGRNALIITSINEFLPESEKVMFIEWLKCNWSKIAEPTEKVGSSTSLWRVNNKEAIENGLWENLFVPRYTFGLYLRDRVTSAIKHATSLGLVNVTLMPCEVISVANELGRFVLELSQSNKDDAYPPTPFVFSSKLVLGLGSPPNKQLIFTEEERNIYIEDMYEPSYKENLQRISNTLSNGNRCETQRVNLDYQSKSSPKNILILGSNASALEVIYTLLDRKDIDENIGKITVISTGGAFPHMINEPIEIFDYYPHHLNSLLSQPETSANDILIAAKKDLSEAERLNIPVADIFSYISEGVVAALNCLTVAEQQIFVTSIGVEIGKLQRRAGKEYLQAVERLEQQNRFEILQGQFKCFRVTSEGKTEVEYLAGSDRTLTVHKQPISLIINCTGFQNVTETSSPLIQSLLKNNISSPTESNRGLCVNEQLEVSKNCYLIGPLIAGNCNNGIRIWHAESCIRIIGIAKQLAEHLLLGIENRTPTSSSQIAA